MRLTNPVTNDQLPKAIVGASYVRRAISFRAERKIRTPKWRSETRADSAATRGEIASVSDLNRNQAARNGAELRVFRGVFQSQPDFGEITDWVVQHPVGTKNLSCFACYEIFLNHFMAQKGS
ncbi:hypothetical protein [Sphingomonas montanisoli]|uniref:hypothetical protein n=1 Tax=Sphingomonas montanisoli TaxID=2606412 RepID=UPI0011F2D7E5|nr:hypothetical protein [Sphingomonas montanisoli]